MQKVTINSGSSGVTQTQNSTNTAAGLAETVKARDWQLPYFGLTVDFEIDETITGDSSNKTAVIKRIIPADPGAPSASGILIIDTLSGDFTENENITGDVLGDAYVKAVQVRNRYAEACEITIEDAVVRICIGGATPVQGGLGHLVNPGESIELECFDEINTFEVISEVSGVHAVLQITPSSYGRSAL